MVSEKSNTLAHLFRGEKKMLVYRVGIVIVLFFLFTDSFAWGQNDFFWSEFDRLDGATNSDASLTFSKGDTGSLFLYYSTDGVSDTDLDTGAFLDIATSKSLVIEFTRAETFDFEIQFADAPVGSRWRGLSNQAQGSSGETGIVTENFIDEWHAFTVTQFGIRETNNYDQPPFDAGFDPDANAFIFGVIDFNVVGEPGESVDILASAGDGLIVNDGVELNPLFGSARISVAIPEPISTIHCLSVLCAMTLASSRKRSRRDS